MILPYFAFYLNLILHHKNVKQTSFYFASNIGAHKVKFINNITILKTFCSEKGDLTITNFWDYCHFVILEKMFREYTNKILYPVYKTMVVLHI